MDGQGSTQAETEPSREELDGAAAVYAAAKPKKPEIKFLAEDELWADPTPDETLVIPELGIAYGPPTLIVGASFVGKTLMAMALGVAIAGGRPVWGRYQAKRGVYVHLDYEQGKAETRRRIHRIAAGLGLLRADLAGRIRISVFPDVNLTTPDAIDAYIAAMTGARVIVVDSLKACTPGMDENSSSLRDLIRVLTVASERTGCAVIIVHHTGLGDPKRGRGTSATLNEAQTEFAVLGTGKIKTAANTKNRPRAELLADFGLTLVDGEGDVMLEPPCDDDFRGDGGVTIGSVLPPLSPLRVEVASLGGIHIARVIEFLTRQNGTFVGNRTAFAKEIGGNRSDVLKAIRALESEGRLSVTKTQIILSSVNGSAHAR